MNQDEEIKLELFARSQASAELAELRAENERLQAYATRLLFEDSRLWHCKKCGSEFSSIGNTPKAEIQCPICEDGIAVPKAWIMQDEIERLSQRIRELEELIEKGNHAINENCKLRQRIRELEEQQRWIPVSERLPEEGEYVSVIFGEDEKTVGCWFLETETEEYQVIGFEYKQWEVWNFGESKFVYVDEPPTHWRPLPEPPEVE